MTNRDYCDGDQSAEIAELKAELADTRAFWETSCRAICRDKDQQITELRDKVAVKTALIANTARNIHDLATLANVHPDLSSFIRTAAQSMLDKSRE